MPIGLVNRCLTVWSKKIKGRCYIIMSKDKNSSKSDKVMPSDPRIRFYATKLDKSSDQHVISVPQKQIFSEELIIRLTDRIKQI